MTEFNVEAFLGTDVVGANATEYVPVPEGVFVGRVSGYDGKMTAGKPEENKPPRPYVLIDWIVEDERVKEMLGMDEPRIRQTLWLDQDSNGGLDMGKGKNVQLGRLRDALGQNDPSRPWQFAMLIDGQAQIEVKHRMGEGQYEGQIFAEVKNVAKL